MLVTSLLWALIDIDAYEYMENVMHITIKDFFDYQDTCVKTHANHHMHPCWDIDVKMLKED